MQRLCAGQYISLQATDRDLPARVASVSSGYIPDMAQVAVPGASHLELRAFPSNIADARHALTHYAEEAGAVDVAAIALAVTEAVSNAVIHGFLGREPGVIEIDARVLVPETLAITVADDGDGMHPRLGSPGLGLGLPLIGELTTELRIGPRAPRGTRVEMRFGLDSAPAHAS
jgi:anti-sigma regulatory factor (Ser/Thr protein kinase)